MLATLSSLFFLRRKWWKRCCGSGLAPSKEGILLFLAILDVAAVKVINYQKVGNLCTTSTTLQTSNINTIQFYYLPLPSTSHLILLLPLFFVIFVKVKTRNFAFTLGVRCIQALRKECKCCGMCALCGAVKVVDVAEWELLLILFMFPLVVFRIFKVSYSVVL